MFTYADIKRQTEAHGERHDCIVRAVACVTDTPYDAALALCTRLGRKPRSGCSLLVAEFAIRELGWRIVNQRYAPFEIGKTIRTFEQFADKQKRYIVSIQGHTLAVRNGVAIDWTHGRCHRITSVFEIERAVSLNHTTTIGNW
jgi:hypothetical protein